MPSSISGKTQPGKYMPSNATVPSFGCRKREPVNSMTGNTLIELIMSDGDRRPHELNVGIRMIGGSNTTASEEQIKTLRALVTMVSEWTIKHTSSQVLEYRFVAPFGSRGGFGPRTTEAPHQYTDATLLINTQVIDLLVDALLELPATSLAVESKQLFLHVIDTVANSAFFPTFSSDVNEITLPALPRLLDALLDILLEPITCTLRSSFLSRVLAEWGTVVPRSCHHRGPVVERLLAVLSAFKSDAPSDQVFEAAVGLFSWNLLDDECQLTEKLVDFLEHVRTCDDTRSVQRTKVLCSLLHNMEPVRFGSNHVLLEGTLQIACFHSNPTVQRCFSDLLTKCAHPTNLCSVRKLSQDAMHWWTERCVPTWADAIVYASREGDAAWQQVGSIIDVLIVHMKDRHLLDEDLSSHVHLTEVDEKLRTTQNNVGIPLFAVSLHDWGCLEKLKDVAHERPSTGPFNQNRAKKLVDAITADNKMDQLRLDHWAWYRHQAFSARDRYAVCAIFSAPLYKHPRSGEISALPSEVAYEVCSYLPIRHYKVRFLVPEKRLRTNGKPKTGFNFPKQGDKSNVFRRPQFAPRHVDTQPQPPAGDDMASKMKAWKNAKKSADWHEGKAFTKHVKAYL